MVADKTDPFDELAPMAHDVLDRSQLPHRGATSSETMAGSACYQAIIVDRQGAGGRMGNRDLRYAGPTARVLEGLGA